MARKAERPERSELLRLVWRRPLTAIAKRYKTSPRTVRSWLLQYELEYPADQAFWKRLHTESPCKFQIENAMLRQNGLIPAAKVLGVSTKTLQKWIKQTGARTPGRSRKRRDDRRPPREELIELVHRMPLKRIGKRLGVHWSTVRCWMRQYDIEPLDVDHWKSLPRKHDPPDRDELRGFLRKMPKQMIAAHYGCCVKTINRWCKSLKLKSPGRYYWNSHRPKALLLYQDIPIKDTVRFVPTDFVPGEAGREPEDPSLDDIWNKLTKQVQDTWDEDTERLRRTGVFARPTVEVAVVQDPCQYQNRMTEDVWSFSSGGQSPADRWFNDQKRKIRERALSSAGGITTARYLHTNSDGHQGRKSRPGSLSETQTRTPQ